MSMDFYMIKAETEEFYGDAGVGISIQVYQGTNSLV